jgi:2'-5' RNA ligase
MRYVIVCTIKGEAQQFHENLVHQITSKFNVRPQKLPAHFTIKAPFEIDDISEIDQLLENFASKHHSSEMKLEGYHHFRRDVIFMDMQLSKTALQTYRELIRSLKTVKDLEWKKNDGLGRAFHCTLVSKQVEPYYDEIWAFVSRFPYMFHCFFDNISIYQWIPHTWILYKENSLT